MLERHGRSLEGEDDTPSVLADEQPVDCFAQLHHPAFGLTTSISPAIETEPMASLLHETLAETKPFSWLLYHAGQHYHLRVPS